jgi:HEAT repeat protein
MTSRSMKWTIVLVLGVFLAIGAVAWWLALPKEPSYQGRTLSSWLDEWGRAYNDPTNEAATAIRAMGSNAVPILLARLSEDEGPKHRKFWRAVQKFIPDDWNPLYRNITGQVTAAQAINLLGTNAQSTFPTLTNLFWGKRQPVTAAIALAGLGHNGVAVLLQALTNQDWVLRLHATDGLAGARSDMDQVIPALVKSAGIKCSKQEDYLLRDAAGLALVQLSVVKRQRVVQAFSELLASPDPETRGFAASRLVYFRYETNTSVPLLLKACHDSDSKVRDAAKNTLRSIDPKGASE